MGSRVDKVLVINYFGGRCTPQETAVVEAWLQQAANRRQMEAWLWEDWQETTGQMPEEVHSALKTRLHQEMGRIEHSRVISLDEASRRTKLPIRQLRLAGAAAVLALVAGLLLFRSANNQPGSIAEVTMWTDSIVNTSDHPQQTLLTDGSTVWLNSGTTLYIANDFGKSRRRVKLSGEAYFEIKQDPAHPFSAQAGKLTTQVLGTAFDMEAWPTEQDTRVLLIQGKVAVQSGDSSCVLLPGQMVTYTRKSGQLISGTLATADPAAWIRGKIVLNRVTLPEALNRLSTLYHTPILYDPVKLQEMYIAGAFDREALPDVLQSILFVHGLHFAGTTGGGYRIY